MLLQDDSFSGRCQSDFSVFFGSEDVEHLQYISVSVNLYPRVHVTFSEVQKC